VTPVVDAIVTFLFKYPARVFARGDIVLAPVVPVMILAAVAVIAVLLIVVLHARVRTLPVRDRLVLGTLRALALLLVLGCLLRPGLVIASAVPQTQRVRRAARRLAQHAHQGCRRHIATRARAACLR
jgi:hypothetical protein